MIPDLEEIEHLIEKVARPENRAEQETAFETLSEDYAMYTICEAYMDLRDENEKLRAQLERLKNG